MSYNRLTNFRKKVIAGNKGVRMERIAVERGSVQETLVIPLYARHVLARTYPELYDGVDTGAIVDRVDYDFADQRRLMDTAFGRFGALEVAQREFDLCEEARAYLAAHPQSAVVNMGAGLLDVFSRVDNGLARGYNLDLPDVIAVRDRLMPAGERERNVACDLNDFSWFDEVDGGRGAVFVAAGVFYYLTCEQVRALLCAMAERFPGCVVVFDTVNRLGLKLMAKTVLDRTGMADIGAYFCVSDATRELGGWSDRIASVTAKSYMNGYRPLGRRYGLLNALLTKLSDSLVHMSIVRVEFAR